MAALIKLRSLKKPFEQVYEENYDRVYTCAYSVLMHKEAAEDVTADTFIAAFENYDKYDPEIASVSTWLARIARNKALNYLNKAEYRQRARIPEGAEEYLGDGSGVMMQKQRDLLDTICEQDLVSRLYSRLNADEREFLTLRYTMGLKDAEVAELMGMNTKAVNKRYQRLLAKCLTILNGE